MDYRWVGPANNEFKKSLNGQTIPIHGKDYATVALSSNAEEF